MFTISLLVKMVNCGKELLREAAKLKSCPKGKLEKETVTVLNNKQRKDAKRA